MSFRPNIFLTIGRYTCGAWLASAIIFTIFACGGVGGSEKRGQNSDSAGPGESTNTVDVFVPAGDAAQVSGANLTEDGEGLDLADVSGLQAIVLAARTAGDGDRTETIESQAKVSCTSYVTHLKCSVFGVNAIRGTLVAITISSSGLGVTGSNKRITALVTMPDTLIKELATIATTGLNKDGALYKALANVNAEIGMAITAKDLARYASDRLLPTNTLQAIASASLAFFNDIKKSGQVPAYRTSLIKTQIEIVSEAVKSAVKNLIDNPTTAVLELPKAVIDSIANAVARAVEVVNKAIDPGASPVATAAPVSTESPTATPTANPTVSPTVTPMPTPTVTTTVTMIAP